MVSSGLWSLWLGWSCDLDDWAEFDRSSALVSSRILPLCRKMVAACYKNSHYLVLVHAPAISAAVPDDISIPAAGDDTAISAAGQQVLWIGRGAVFNRTQSKASFQLYLIHLPSLDSACVWIFFTPARALATQPTSASPPLAARIPRRGRGGLSDEEAERSGLLVGRGSGLNEVAWPTWAFEKVVIPDKKQPRQVPQHALQASWLTYMHDLQACS